MAGAISIASQSGNTTSSFLNYANSTGVGIARAVSAGNAAAVSVADYLRWYRDDPATRVAFAYLEHSADGRAVFDGIRSVTAEKPVVLVKGGVTGAGQQAAASHTGALAGEQRIFTGAMRQAGVCLVPHRGGGVRRRRHLRHPAVAEGAQHGGGDHGRAGGAS